MSARKIENITEGNQFKAEVESLNILKIGFHHLTLTNMDSDLEPQIEAGSFLELNGTIYEWKNTISIEGSFADHTGITYIRTDVTLSDGEYISLIYDTTLTNNDFGWDAAKKGNYDGDGNRVICLFAYDGVEGTCIGKKYLLDKM